MMSFISTISADYLAFLVLVVLVFCAISSFFINSRFDPKASKRGLYSILMILFPFIGFPAALDLMTTTGYTKVFAIIIFFILLIPVAIALVSYIKTKSLALMDQSWNWFVPLFIIGGLIVSGYLTYVELTSSTAVCGVAIPGCGEVQNSSYAVMFGFLPVALLGVVGYVGIFLAWAAKKWLPAATNKLFSLSMWGLAFFGILYSSYLAYLEVFVLRATCTWCILAAVFMIMLFWISIQDAKVYLVKDQDDELDEESDQA